MGVTGLWDVVKDKCDVQCSVPVSTLKGKTLAVDISGWIVELRMGPNAADVKNMHIRNLYYRIIGLLNEGVNVVAVLDGKAPDLKSKTLMKRQSSHSVGLDRLHLKRLSKECVQLLECFGIKCLQCPGEAEALCADLEVKGVVDGCITKDGDYFCYGGKTVYRNMRKCKEKKVFVVDVYSAERSELTQEDFISLALLCGCDYDAGIAGVGHKTTIELIEYLKGKYCTCTTLDRILSWKENTELINIEEKIGQKIKKQPHCTRCKHKGSVKSHKGECATWTPEGCDDDSSVTCRCVWHKRKQLEAEHKIELSVRQKALENSDFPNMEVVQEFRGFTMDVPDIQMSYTINIEALSDCLKNYLDFRRDKTVHFVTETVILQDLLKNKLSSSMFYPVSVDKKCTDNHVQCFLIKWQKTEKNLWAETDPVELKVEQELFKSVYPEEVEKFEEEQKQKKSSKTTGKKKKKKQDDEAQEMKKQDNEELEMKTHENEAQEMKKQNMKKRVHGDKSQPSSSSVKKIRQSGHLTEYFKIKK